jgi:predicted Zn-dependent protease
MWGRNRRTEELIQRISALNEEVEDQRSEYITLTNLNNKLNDQITVLHRHVGDAQRARDEADEKAYDLARQIDHLARWFQDNAPDKIRGTGAINSAIALLDEGKRFEEENTNLQDLLAESNALMGKQDAEIKQLKIDLAAAHKTLTEGGAVTVITDPELTKEIEDALDHPETLVKRDRPKRKP